MPTKKAARITERKIKAMVDKLGDLRAVIALAGEQEEAIRDTLVSLRRDVFTGTHYDATVSRYVQTDLDVKALKANVRRSVWSPYERRRNCVTLRVTARVKRRRRPR